MGWLNYGLGEGLDRVGEICCIDGDRSSLGICLLSFGSTTLRSALYSALYATVNSKDFTKKQRSKPVSIGKFPTFFRQQSLSTPPFLSIFQCVGDPLSSVSISNRYKVAQSAFPYT